MRLSLVALLLTFAVSGCRNYETPMLTKLPDGSDAFSLRAFSGPFQAGSVSEEQVIGEAVADHRLCLGRGYDIVSKRNAQPDNYSVVIVDALVRCR